MYISYFYTLDLIQTTHMTQAEKVAFSENLTINIISSSLFFFEIM